MVTQTPTAQDAIIARLAPAVRALAECRNAKDAKRVADIARAAEIYGQRQRLSQEAIAHATAVKIDAMTLMGEMLKATPKAPAGRPAKEKIGSPAEPISMAPPTLADLGISKKESSAAQALAKIKEAAPEVHEQVRTGDMSIGKARKVIAQRARNRASEQQADEPHEPAGKPAKRKQVEEVDPEDYRTAFILRADVALEFAEKEYTGPITPDMIDLARRVASAWADLAATLEASR